MAPPACALCTEDDYRKLLLNYRDKISARHPPCGGRPFESDWHPGYSHISIHALRVEGDYDRRSHPENRITFLSTPSVWRATPSQKERPPSSAFLSTPSVWRATPTGWTSLSALSISIHALRVEGDSLFNTIRTRTSRFLSTPSAWRATSGAGRAGCWEVYFYPRPPCGGRRYKSGCSVPRAEFLSTPSVWRATGRLGELSRRKREFLSTPSVWRAT